VRPAAGPGKASGLKFGNWYSDMICSAWEKNTLHSLLPSKKGDGNLKILQQTMPPATS